MPEFQNPTGTSLTREERLQMLARKHDKDLPLIEDIRYEKLRYDGERVPSLLALDIERKGGIENSRVIYCGTFSKSIVPALRIGWIVAAKPVIQKLVIVKQASDLHVSTLNQIVMHEVALKIIEDQARRILPVYKARRDAMLAALEAHMPKGVRWTKPEGGMFVWASPGEHVDSAQIAIEAARNGIMMAPGNMFRPHQEPMPFFRFNAAHCENNATFEFLARILKA